MTITVVYGVQGCGKTRMSEKLRVCFDASHIVDDWNGVSPLADGALALTSNPWFLVPPGGRLLTFDNDPRDLVDPLSVS